MQHETGERSPRDQMNKWMSIVNRWGDWDWHPNFTKLTQQHAEEAIIVNEDLEPSPDIPVLFDKLGLNDKDYGFALTLIGGAQFSSNLGENSRWEKTMGFLFSIALSNITHIFKQQGKNLLTIACGSEGGILGVVGQARLYTNLSINEDFDLIGPVARANVVKVGRDGLGPSSDELQKAFLSAFLLGNIGPGQEITETSVSQPTILNYIIERAIAYTDQTSRGETAIESPHPTHVIYR